MWAVLYVALGLGERLALDEENVAATQAATMRAGVAVWDVLANVHVKGQQ